MKIQKIIYALLLSVFLMFSCNKEVKTAQVAIAISGMTCEIGCAKMIQSKLSKKEGVAAAEVIFKDSIAKVTFDMAKTSKSEIIAMINGIADGTLYSAKETKLLK